MGAKTLLEENVQRAIESDGITIGDKTVFGKVDATVHDDGTADITVDSNGRKFKCVIQLDIYGGWKILDQ